MMVTLMMGEGEGIGEMGDDGREGGNNGEGGGNNGKGGIIRKGGERGRG